MSTRNVYMPEVDDLPSDRLEQVFNLAHDTSLGKRGGVPAAAGQRCVAMISPGRLMRQFLTPPPNTMAPNMTEMMKSILALPPKRVVAIGFTATLVQADMKEVGAAIPFFGFLIGLAYIGHSVVLFEGHPLAFEGGVRGAEMLLVDSEMTPFLPDHWTETAFRVMKTPEVNIYNADNPQASRVQRIIDPIKNVFNNPRHS